MRRRLVEWSATGLAMIGDPAAATRRVMDPQRWANRGGAARFRGGRTRRRARDRACGRRRSPGDRSHATLTGSPTLARAGLGARRAARPLNGFVAARGRAWRAAASARHWRARFNGGVLSAARQRIRRWANRRRRARRHAMATAWRTASRRPGCSPPAAAVVSRRDRLAQQPRVRRHRARAATPRSTGARSAAIARGARRSALTRRDALTRARAASTGSDARGARAARRARRRRRAALIAVSSGGRRGAALGATAAAPDIAMAGTLGAGWRAARVRCRRRALANSLR
ncbi:MAG: hypothetical protein WDW36_001841 [Sanguina aurantia]